MKQVGRLVVVLVAVLVLHPAAATADVLVRRDPAGDVARSPIGAATYTPAPTRVEGDITSTRVTHGRRTIRIAVRLRELTTLTNGNFHHIAIASNRRFRSIELDAFPGHWEGRVVTTTRTGRVVGCRVSHRIDYVRNLVVVVVPRSCLRRPAWVRVAVRSTVAGTRYAFTDDARASGLPAAAVFGPRIRR